MLTGLKVSSVACKRIFHTPEHNAKGVPMEMNFEGLEMQKWNIPTGRIMVIKLYKVAHFFVFSADDSKMLVTVCTWKILLSSFTKWYGK